MIERPVYILVNTDAPGMGSWLSSGIKKVVGVVVGKGNTPGTPETRKYGYDRAEVAAAVAQNLATDTSTNPATNPQGKLILAGAAGVALLLLLSGGRKYGR